MQKRLQVMKMQDLFQLDELAEMNEGPLSNFFLYEHDVQQLE